MKKRQFIMLWMLTINGCLLLSSCARTGDDIWDDTKSAGRHVGRGMRALGGKHGDSRQIHSRTEFEGIDSSDVYFDEQHMGDFDYQDRRYQTSEFVPLQDQANGFDMLAPPPRETPGERGSSIPGIDYFRDPHTIPQLSGLFRNIYFEYNSNMVKGELNLQTLHAIADYMRHHPNLYVFIEGHADERGPQSYNLALGSRRANSVRNLLINEGVNPNNLFTISYGKERPVVLEHHEEAWSKNRRVEFKVYER
jgi:peptidoglycan-associated lipoprotein